MPGHFATARGATLANLNAFFHATNLATGLRTSFTNLRAGSASFAMQGRIQQHDVSRRPASFHASQHDPKMFRLDMRATFFQAVAGGRVETNPIAIQADIDTFIHFRAWHFQILILETRKSNR
ncbi:hypothetical protein [Brucella sp. LJL56]